MSLLCALFGHRPAREPVFNDGFYFATCKRCWHDVVRVPDEKWHRPRNAHVVWSRTPPPTARQACLQRISQGPLQPWADLPAYTRISGSAAREIRQGTLMPSTQAEQRRSSIPDFMDDPEVPIEAAPARQVPRGPRPVPRPVRVA